MFLAGRLKFEIGNENNFVLQIAIVTAIAEVQTFRNKAFNKNIKVLILVVSFKIPRYTSITHIICLSAHPSILLLMVYIAFCSISVAFL